METKTNVLEENQPKYIVTVDEPLIDASVPAVNELTDYMRKGLAVVAQNEGFVNYSVHDEKGSNVGDGFIGIMFKVHIQEVNSDKQLTVMLKAPPASLSRRIELGALLCFKREVLMYTKVLPAFVAFQREKKIKEVDGFFNFPKCYFAEFDEVLQDSVVIMEDLKASGYAMWDKFAPTNFEHSRLVMEALGRLHAISFAMKDQRPNIFNEFKELNDFMVADMPETFRQMMDGYMDRAIANLPEHATVAKNKMLELKLELREISKWLVSGKNAEPFAIVGHGDCWSNNFMYKYRGNNPKGVVLLDWQLSRYGSPVLDLMYFIFICTDSAMRAKHYDELLEIYHKAMEKLLNQLGGDITSQFPFTAFLRQLKTFGKFGITIAIFLIPMSTAKSEDLPDMDKMSENFKNQDATSNLVNSSIGDSRLSGSIMDAIEYGYL